MNQLRTVSSIVLGSLVIILLTGCVSSGGLPAPVENRSLDTARGKAPVFDAKNPDLRATPGSDIATPAGGAPVTTARPPLAGADAQAALSQPEPESVEGPNVESVPIQSGRIETRPIAADQGADTAPVISMGPAPQAPAANTDPGAGAGESATPETAPAMPPMASRDPSSESLPQAPEAVAPAEAPAAAAPTVANSNRPFIWPASGDVTQSFTDPKSMGIAIAGKAGDPVSAAADGRVIFSGLGPRGYGKLLIVEHDDDLLSVYGNNRALLVKEGQAVRQGQRIAELGSSGTDLPRLHFEIRRLGKPVDPISYLPPSAN